MRSSEILKILREKPFPKAVAPLAKIHAFALRDVKVWATYKLWFALDIAGTLFNAAAYFFFSAIVSPGMLAEAGYTGDYFSFAIVGLALQQYVFLSVEGIVESIREEQGDGTLETVLSSPTDLKTFLLGSSAFRFLVSTAYLASIFVLGLLGGAKVTHEPLALLSAVTMAILLIVSHLPIGFLVAAVSLKTKAGNPVAVAFSWLTQLLSGVLYPLNLLPPWLSPFVALTPLAYSLEATRRVLLNGETLLSLSVYGNALILLTYSALVMPLSLYAFKRAYRAVLTTGELGQY